MNKLMGGGKGKSWVMGKKVCECSLAPVSVVECFVGVLPLHDRNELLLAVLKLCLVLSLYVLSVISSVITEEPSFDKVYLIFWCFFLAFAKSKTVADTPVGKQVSQRMLRRQEWAR